jgi:polysaccharide biosynthesis protein PslJ
VHERSTAETAQVVAVVACIGLITASTLAGPSALRVAPVAACLALIAVYYRRLLAWPSLISGLLLIVLFLPIRRYTIPFNLPFQLEPYRIYALLLLGIWIVALLIDRRFRVQPTGLEAPIAFLGGVLILSVLVNAHRVNSLGLSTDVAKSLTFWLSWIVLFFVIATVTVRVRDVEAPVKLLVAGGAVLGLLGLIESKVGYNPFNHLEKVFPFLVLTETPSEETTFRAGQVRVFGSAQHPIAFGAALAMLAPLALYLAYRLRKPYWWLALALILIGSTASVSRTSIIMLVTSTVVIVVLRRDARRLLPLAVPLAIVVQLAVPGTFGTYKALFFPEEGLVEQQAQSAVGQGRVASLGPALDQAAERPLLGLGYGTRIPVGEKKNSFILDDQWLANLLETGVLGVFAWLWLFWRFGRRASKEAKADGSDRGWLLAVLAASVTSFAVGMIFYDAFSFIQVTILTFVLMGLGCALLRTPRGGGDNVAVP